MVTITSMVSYYETLKISPKASKSEIKSAYRRLARKLHPDANSGSEQTALAFAAIAEAYEILGNPKERALYDQKILEAKYNGIANGDSVFASTNSHARRWRQMAYEHRYNEIIDRMIADERRESLSLQKIIFPIVALFISTAIVAVFRPQIFSYSAIIGKIIIVSLFVAGAIHLVSRLRDAIEKYTYSDADLHDSILDDREVNRKPLSRVVSWVFLLFGLGVCFAIGSIVAQFIVSPAEQFPWMSNTLTLEIFFYPPIFVLAVDIVHNLVSRFDK